MKMVHRLVAAWRSGNRLEAAIAEQAAERARALKAAVEAEKARCLDIANSERDKPRAKNDFWDGWSEAAQTIGEAISGRKP